MKHDRKSIIVKVVELKFKTVLSKYLSSDKTVDNLFEDVYNKYTSSERHYHDIMHIYRLCMLWEKNKNLLGNPDVIFLAIIFHDIIYKVRKNDNEIKSAEYFEKIVKDNNISFSSQFIDDVKCAIAATKHDEASKAFWNNNSDIQYLLDFDLEILSVTDSLLYEWYRKGVRKEYRIYPNILYKSGRKKVLESFLNRDKIYLTDEFHKENEKQARKNLQNEINLYLC